MTPRVVAIQNKATSVEEGSPTDTAVVLHGRCNGTSRGCSPERPSSCVLSGRASNNWSRALLHAEKRIFRETSHESESRTRELLVMPHLVCCILPHDKRVK